MLSIFDDHSNTPPSPDHTLLATLAAPDDHLFSGHQVGGGGMCNWVGDVMMLE